MYWRQPQRRVDLLLHLGFYQSPLRQTDRPLAKGSAAPGGHGRPLAAPEAHQPQLFALRRVKVFDRDGPGMIVDAVRASRHLREVADPFAAADAVDGDR